MARVSRPPGFDMTYKPEGSKTFGPPMVERLPAFAYLTLATIVVSIILYGQNGASSTSWLFEYIVVRDQTRIVSSTTCAVILMVSALAAVIRAHMRGVVIHPDGIEMRELLTLGVPRIRRLHWSQIDQVMVPGMQDGQPSQKKTQAIGLSLWDGSTTWLPRVEQLMDLAVIIEKVALARAIPIVGGTGLIDDLGNPLDDMGD